MPPHTARIHLVAHVGAVHATQPRIRASHGMCSYASCHYVRLPLPKTLHASTAPTRWRARLTHATLWRHTLKPSTPTQSQTRRRAQYGSLHCQEAIHGNSLTNSAYLRGRTAQDAIYVYGYDSRRYLRLARLYISFHEPKRRARATFPAHHLKRAVPALHRTAAAVSPSASAHRRRYSPSKFKISSPARCLIPTTSTSTTPPVIQIFLRCASRRIKTAIYGVRHVYEAGGSGLQAGHLATGEWQEVPAAWEIADDVDVGTVNDKLRAFLLSGQ
ncbi:hypothetical protein C8R44DRAFT_753435 [Mycena epipterygia]|nr:hypothetical protein C8R44DRAFT_753435 [Mycena epipterygia]